MLDDSLMTTISTTLLIIASITRQYHSPLLVQQCVTDGLIIQTIIHHVEPQFTMLKHGGSLCDYHHVEPLTLVKYAKTKWPLLNLGFEPLTLVKYAKSWSTLVQLVDPGEPLLKPSRLTIFPMASIPAPLGGHRGCRGVWAVPLAGGPVGTTAARWLCWL